jgi:hypothetical protein
VLNYIWVALILLGVSAALTTDIINNSNDKYRNNTPFPVVISTNDNSQLEEGNQNVKILVSAREFNRFYGSGIKSDLVLNAELNYKLQSGSGFITITTDKNFPEIWKEMAGASGEKNKLSGTIRIG